MKIRTTLTLLALLAFVSIGLGGVYYYYSLQKSAYSVAYRRAAQRTEMIKTQVSGFLSENMKPVRALAVIQEIRQAAQAPSPQNVDEANRILDLFKKALDVDVCYLMDRRGRTVASSNRHEPDSFVGQNFSFRPYFKEAMDGQSGKYLALGTTSKKRGAYFSYPVYGPEGGPNGVAVIKVSIKAMEKSIIQTTDGITMLVGPRGIIFSTNRNGWLYQTMWKLGPDDQNLLAASRQFGLGPWEWTGLEHRSSDKVVDRSGHEYVINSLPIDDFQAWRVVHLVGLREISESVLKPMVRSTSLLVFFLCLIGGLAVYYLFNKARQEIDLRKIAEDELRQSEERYRALYHNTPAMLLSLDREGRIIRVSDYWTEGFGYVSEEVVGRKFTEFLTEESRRRAEEATLPELLETGVCRDVSYRLVKRNGEVIHVLMAGMAERGQDGRIQRILAVLIDITERIRAEEKLREAQEQLSNYSKDLEKQVRARTREVAGFLEYTPAVIYMKDAAGRYILINSRHEELFGTSKEEIKGKTVHDVFPEDIARQFRDNDLKVLASRQPYQAEEIAYIKGEKRVILSVRFPLLDEKGDVNRLCGISVDVTELKEAQEKLRKLSGSIITNQEKERSAIARELHDELGQILTALRMDAVWLRDHLRELDLKSAERAEAMCDIIDSTITEVGSIARRLRPAVLDDLGLVDGLEWHTTDFESRTGIVCVFKKGSVPPVGEVLSIAAYRVAQEALTNVARHSGATHVEVSLASDNGDLVLSVRDNGVGFDPDRAAAGEQLGLAGMKERAYLAGGRLEIISKLGEGAEVYLRLPLNAYGGETGDTRSFG